MASTVVPTGNLIVERSLGLFGARLAEFFRQARARDQLFFAHDRGALENVAQFANISRPGVAHENVQHFRADAAHVLAVLGVDVAQDVLDQQRDIVFVFAQRRQIDVKDVQAEK